MRKPKTPKKPAHERVVDHFGSAAAVARALGYKDRRNVTKWVKGEIPFPAYHCALIQKATNGAITCKELRPKDFAKHWPDLEEA
jgi:DNA-binding transcriptional regulator YdaS (Cro superfamily)